MVGNHACMRDTHFPFSLSVVYLICHGFTLSASLTSSLLLLCFSNSLFKWQSPRTHTPLLRRWRRSGVARPPSNAGRTAGEEYSLPTKPWPALFGVVVAAAAAVVGCCTGAPSLGLIHA